MRLHSRTSANCSWCVTNTTAACISVRSRPTMHTLNRWAATCGEQQHVRAQSPGASSPSGNPHKRTHAHTRAHTPQTRHTPHTTLSEVIVVRRICPSFVRKGVAGSVPYPPRSSQVLTVRRHCVPPPPRAPWCPPPTMDHPADTHVPESSWQRVCRASARSTARGIERMMAQGEWRACVVCARETSATHASQSSTARDQS
jgi:hypothetical protein